MTQGFFQFNNFIINEITEFATSSYDLLFVSGPKGSGKSEAIDKVIPMLEDNNLAFWHFCFENSVIDDFLLNFYDALRDFSLSQKIALKKFASNNFKEKVSHYFKIINNNCIIAVENYEKVEDSREITDFLSHLAGYEKVKLIIVSRNSDKNPFESKNLRIKNLKIQEENKENFKNIIKTYCEEDDEEFCENFYEITRGLELYLKMSIKYCLTTGVKLKDLAADFERRNQLINTDWEEFMVSKFVSLTPNIHQGLFRMLCSLSHPVGTFFIKEYKLGNVDYISYLVKNFLLSRFKDEVYVKDYFREYITSSFSVREKYSYYKTLIKIYENELTKSPKDRLLRLSRESIRKELDKFYASVPALKIKNKDKNELSYLGINLQNWQDESQLQKSKLSEKLTKIKEKKQLLLKETADEKHPKNEEQNNKELSKEKNSRYIVSLINKSRELTSQYSYKSALEELEKAIKADYDNEFKIELYTLCAKNHEYLIEYDAARDYYTQALDLALKTKDSRKCELEFLIAMTYKNLFKIDIAKESFTKIANNESNPPNYRAKAYLELGEIEGASSDKNKAISDYEKALSYTLGKNNELSAKCYYKLAVLYDENQDTENAVKYYKKNYTISSQKTENKYYSASLTNLGLIYTEHQEYDKASEFLKMALQYDSENYDLENMYFSQKELTKIYLKTNNNISNLYYKEAINTARKLCDKFKEALVYFETGEFYYDKGDDERALEQFFSAKKVLEGTSNNENIQRINSRIKDIKIRLDNLTFDKIAKKYD